MGVCVSSEVDTAGRLQSERIDSQLTEELRRLKKEAKILLLGSGESGKSTIVKQMKILHQNGYTLAELQKWRPIVNKNLVDSAQAIVLAMRTLNVDPENGANRTFSQQILDFHYNPSIESDPEFTLPPALADAVESVWNDPIMPRILDQSNQFYLMDSAAYFFNDCRRICDPKYVPTVNDVLRARAKTTGITETRFVMDALHIHMFDVGGQRSERRKWIHCFESVTSIIFCVAISEYDQTLLEEKTQNRMHESLVLFESVVNSRWFLSTSIILFLNKIDVFREKIARSPLNRIYPEYTGGADVNKATKFLVWKFVNMNRAKLALYPHLTQATDTRNIRIVFAAVKETILQNQLRETGIL